MMEMNDRYIDSPELDENGYPLQPVMNFFPNDNGKLCVTLWGWDTRESINGYTIEDIDALIESLQDAKNFIINNNETQGTFLFTEGDSDD